MDGKKKTRAAIEQSLHLPEEIVEEILSRLAVKSLLRLRCVLKSWLSLIDDKEFIKTHLQYSTKNTDSAHYRVIIFTGGEPKQCSLRALLEEPARTDLSPLGPPILPELALVTGSCNGLICVYQGGRFFLLNPSTRVSKKFPKDPVINTKNTQLHLIKIGLGWDQSSGAYKVFAGWVRYCTNYLVILRRNRVYSLKTNSWKTVEQLPYPTIGKVGNFVGGKLHWLSRKLKKISSFDLKSEVFGTIELPDQIKEGCLMLLGVLAGCLCLSTEYNDGPENSFDVWVMKEPWEKLATIDLGGEPRHRLGLTMFIIGEVANGEILIAFGMSLLLYCPRRGVIRQRREIGCFGRACMCLESLVSPLGAKKGDYLA